MKKIEGGGVMAKAVFQLEQLTCPTCVKKIETALKNTDGVEKAEASFNSSKVKVDFDETKIESQKIEKVIKKLGYVVITSQIK